MIISDLNYMKVASNDEVKGAAALSAGLFGALAVGSSPAGLAETAGEVILETAQPALGAPAAATAIVGVSISI
jgi:hypothetical protein